MVFWGSHCRVYDSHCRVYGPKKLSLKGLRSGKFSGGAPHAPPVHEAGFELQVMGNASYPPQRVLVKGYEAGFGMQVMRLGV